MRVNDTLVSWWIGLSREQFAQQWRREAVRMKDTKPHWGWAEQWHSYRPGGLVESHSGQHRRLNRRVGLRDCLTADFESLPRPDWGSLGA